MKRRILNTIGTTIVLSLLLVSPAFAELPAKLQQQIDKATEDLTAKYKSANDVLIAAFDDRIEQARRAPKLTAEMKQSWIGALEAEKSIFQKSGWIPFSPTMRSDSITYLTSIQKAEIAAAKAYDEGIGYHTKRKEDALARDVLANKKATLAPKVVGKWALRDVDGKFTSNATLFSDGTKGGNGTWTLDGKALVWRAPDAKAPGGAWISTAVASPDGREIQVTLQNGYKMAGSLAVPQ